MRKLVLAGVALVVAAGIALANGRPPGTSTINFKQGNDNEIAAGMTFGLLVSHDGGLNWDYMCEDAVGYGGMYDPDYAFSSTGALGATTFDGLQIQRDMCTFSLTSLAPAAPNVKFFSAITLGPDHALYAAASNMGGDSKVYKSTDDGLTFPQSTKPAQDGDWWQSIEVAPSNANRVYLAGYRFSGTKSFLLFRSDNGGVSFAPLPLTAFTLMPNSTLEIAGVSKTNPDVVFAQVRLEDNTISDALYVSTNAGQTWKRILGKGAAIAFLVRKSGEIVAGTKDLGTVKSIDNGTTWQDVTGAPHIGCLAENAAGEVWACTQNFATMTTPSDGFGIMKSTNLTSWAGVLKFQDIRAPVSCAPGTVQHDKCDAQLWCGLCLQLGCDPKRPCPGFGADGGTDGPRVKDPGGCCQSQSTGNVGGGALLVMFVAIIALRPRRR
jgi:photosystem II stability/assembly factor-like uncharacterized protein